jgi:hypothetical protein
MEDNYIYITFMYRRAMLSDPLKIDVKSAGELLKGYVR